MIRRLRLISGLVMLAYVTMPPEPRCRSDLARCNGERALVHVPDLDEPTGATAALWQLSRSLRVGAVRPLAEADIAAARVRAPVQAIEGPGVRPQAAPDRRPLRQPAGPRHRALG